MKLFTIEEANSLIPQVRSMLEDIQMHYRSVEFFRDSASAAAAAAEAGGGMAGGSRYVKALYNIGKLTTDLHEMGIQLKDHARGLVDFPCEREGKIVLLCWQLGEADEIAWWHDLESGFAGRRPL